MSDEIDARRAAVSVLTARLHAGDDPELLRQAVQDMSRRELQLGIVALAESYLCCAHRMWPEADLRQAMRDAGLILERASGG